MFLHELGTSVCHQRLTRSFAFGENVLPLCSRCTGIYLGAFLIYLFFLISSRRKRSGLPSKQNIYILIGFVFLMGLDVGTAILEIRESNNSIRLLTGLLTGFSLVSFLYPITNFVLWKRKNEKSIMSDYKELIMPIMILAIFFLLINFEFNPIFPVAAVFSILGILLLYLNINLVVVINIFKKENTFEGISKLINFVPLAVLLAGIELYLLRLYHVWIKNN